MRVTSPSVPLTRLSGDLPLIKGTLESISTSLQQLNYGALRVFNSMNKHKAKAISKEDVSRYAQRHSYAILDFKLSHFPSLLEGV